MSPSLRFAPMPLAVLDQPFDHDGFIFELKYDGFRALAHETAAAASFVKAGLDLNIALSDALLIVRCHGHVSGSRTSIRPDAFVVPFGVLKSQERALYTQMHSGCPSRVHTEGAESAY